MNGELAQVMVLAAHGSGWLRRGEGAAPRLDVESSTFQYVRAVSFFSSGGAAASGGGAIDAVAPWLVMLRDSGVDRLWLTTKGADDLLPPHVAASFAGGGNWRLLATGAGASPALWIGAWAVGDRNASDGRVWDIRYTGVALPPVEILTPLGPSVEAAEPRLVDALVAAQGFARQQGLDFWVDYLGKALDLRSATQPEAPYHSDLLPTRGYGDDSRRLVAMASQAWVFGGMGSWNDLGFPDPEDLDRYKRVTHELYDAVVQAAVAAVNADPTA